MPVVAKGTGDIEQGYRNDSKYSDRKARANSEDPDQTVP